MPEKRSIATIRSNSTFTKEVVMRFYEAVRYGAKIRHACQYAGINVSTYYTWRRRALNGEEPYATFLRGVEQAQGEFVARNLEAIHAHTAIDWKAAAWLLERSYPQEYAMRQYVEEEPALLRDLKELVSGGLVTVAEIRKEMPDLPDEYLTILMALEARLLTSVPSNIEAAVEAQQTQPKSLPQALQNKLISSRTSGDSYESPVQKPEMAEENV